MKKNRNFIDGVLANLIFWLALINLIFLVRGGQEWLNANWEWSFICSAPSVTFFIVAMIGTIVLSIYGMWTAANNLQKEES